MKTRKLSLVSLASLMMSAFAVAFADPIQTTGNAAANTAAIQSAIDAAAIAATPGTVTLAEGEFTIDAQLMVTGGVTLVGQGWEQTTVKQTGTNVRVATIGGGAKLQGVTEKGETSYLTIAEPGEGEGALQWNVNIPDLGNALGGAYYSLIPADVSWKNIYIELYNWENAVVGVSQSAEYEDLVKEFVYAEMSTAGTHTPYVFTAAIPEPSGGLLFLLGIGVMALRRKKSKSKVEVEG